MSTSDLLSSASNSDSLDGELIRSPEPLFSPMQIASATLLGGMLAAAALMALNYRRMGNSAAAVAFVAIGLLATVVQVQLLLDLPRGFPAVALYLPMMLTTFGLSNWLQGDAYADQVTGGGPIATNAEPVVISILCLAATALAGLAIAAW